MNKTFAYPVLALLIASCSGGSNTPQSKPYKFDRDKLDKAVSAKKMMYDVSKRPNGTLYSETFYYIPDTGKLRLEYDDKSNIQRVIKYDEHGQSQWFETYYPNGQRKSHYPTKPFKELGPESAKHGYYETYFEDGKVMEIGQYEKDLLLWSLEFDKEGQPGDTTRYDYSDRTTPPPAKAEADSPSTSKKPKVEKIETATTPN
jgi:antitoxin component YwqK of YwqJK toxin-antitoxin module